MEGGECFSRVNKNNEYPLLKPIIPPSSTTMDRSLSSQFSDLQILTNKEALFPTSSNVICNFGSSSVSTITGASHVRGSVFDGIFLNEQQNRKCSGQEKNPNIFSPTGKENLAQDIRIGMGMVEKSGLSATVIKGQWTRDEDRKLKNLVKHYGVEQWPQVAEKMARRTRKQCWERWHNHLRPDIKKGNWTEKEERLFVEAHMEVGNRWQEISKRLAGRTKNSVQNHWHSSEKSLNSMKRCKKRAGNNGQNQLTILQEYIKSICANDSLTTNINLNTTTQLYSDPLDGANGLISPEGYPGNSMNREMKMDELDLELRL